MLIWQQGTNLIQSQNVEERRNKLQCDVWLPYEAENILQLGTKELQQHQMVFKVDGANQNNNK